MATTYVNTNKALKQQVRFNNQQKRPIFGKVNRLQVNIKHTSHDTRRRNAARNLLKRFTKFAPNWFNHDEENWLVSEPPKFVSPPTYGTFEEPICGDLSYPKHEKLVNIDNEENFEYLIPQAGISTTPILTEENEIISQDIVSTSTPDFKLDYNVTSSVNDLSQHSIFDRPYLYPNSFEWTTSNTRFELLTSMELPNAFFQLENIAPFGALNYHALYKSSFNITIKTDATNYNQGILVAFAVPGNTTEYDAFSNLNYATVMNYPHVFLHVGTENEVSFMAPYSHIFSAISPESRQLGVSNNIYFMVWSPLKAGTSAPSTLTISTWLQPIDTHLSVKTTALISQSSIIKPIAHLILDNFSIPYADKIKSIGKIFGVYDRVPRDDMHPESAISGDVGITVINSKINQLEVIPKMSNRYNQREITDFIQFAKIPSLCNVVQWNTSHQTGKIIDIISISPTNPMISGGVVGTVNTWLATNLAGVASLYTLYRGSIELEIVVVASSFHRGTLLIAFDPYGNANAVKSQIYGLPSVSFSLGSESNSIKIRLPYNKHKDYVKTLFNNISENEQIGHVYVIVQNALKAPVSVSGAVELMFYVNAGPDAEFKYPIRPSKRTILQQADGVYQSSSFYENDLVEPGFIIGDHTNILNFMRRINYIKLTETSVVAGTTGLSRDVYGGRLPEKGYHGLVKQLFKYNSGGVTIHFVTNVTAMDSAVRYLRYDNGPHEYDFASTSNPTQIIAIDNVWMGAATQVNKSPAQNYLIPGYNEIPFFYNSTTLAKAPNDQNWKSSLNYQTFYAHTLQEAIGHSVADDFNFYLPMSMFKLGSLATLTLEGGIIPLMTAPTTGGITVAGTNVTGILNAFDESFLTAATPTTNGASVIFNITLNSNINKIVTRMFMAAQCKKDDAQYVTVSLIGAKLGGGNDTLLTFDGLDAAIGFNEVPGNFSYSIYTLQFTTTLPTWSLRVEEIQLYALNDIPIFPPFTSNDSPLGFEISRGTLLPHPTDLWHILSGDDSLIWTSDQPGVSNNLLITGPEYYRATEFSISAVAGPSVWLVYGLPASGAAVTLYSGTTSLNNAKLRVGLKNVDHYQHYLLGFSASASLIINNIQFYSEGVIPQCGICQFNEFEILDKQISEIEKFYNNYDLAENEYQTLGLSELTAGYNAVKNFFSQIKDAIISIRQVGDVANTVATTINSVKGIFIKLMNVILGVVNIINGLYVVMNSQVNALICNGVAGMVGAVFNITCSVELNEELQAQTNSVFDDFITKIRDKSGEAADIAAKWLNSDNLISIFTGLFKKLGYKSQLAEIFNRENGDHPERGTVCNVLHSALAFFLHGKDYVTVIDNKFNREITDYKLELTKFSSSIKLGTTFEEDGKKITYVDKFNLLKEKYQGFLKRSALVKNRSDTNIRAVEMELDKLDKKIHKIGLEKPHIEPVSAFFCGDSGVGKTILTGHIIPMILNQVLRNNKNYKHVDYGTDLYRETHPNLTHYMISSDSLKFDSLYRHQPFIVLDDAFTERNGLDSALLTRLVNSAPLEVAKADVSDKGDIYDSQFILITSNEADPVSKASEFINSAGKITRRLGMMYQISLKPTPKNTIPKRFSMDLINIHDKMTIEERHDELFKVIDSIYIFTKLKYENNSSTPVVAGTSTFRGIIENLHTEFIRKSEFMDPKFDLLAGLCPQSGDSDSNSDYVSVDDDDEYFVDDLLDTLTYTPYNNEAVDLYFDGVQRLVKRNIELEKELLAFKNDIKVDVRWKEMLGLTEVKQKVLKYWKGMDFTINKAISLCTGENLAKIGFASAALTAAIFGIKKIAEYLTTNITSCYQNLVYEGIKTNTVKHIPVNRLIPQVGIPNYNEHELNEIRSVRKQLHMVGYFIGDALMNTSHCFFLNQNTILINKHFFANGVKYPDAEIRIQQKSILEESNTKENIVFKVVAISADQIRSYGPNCDLVVCTLSVNWPNVPNFKPNKICKEELKNTRAIFIGDNQDEDVIVNWKGDKHTLPMCDGMVDVNWIGYPGNYISQFGDCGRPYYVLGKGLMGLHSALHVSSGCGAATIIPNVIYDKTPEVAYEVQAREITSRFWQCQAPLMAQTKIDGINQDRFVCRKSKYEKIEPAIIEEDECDVSPAVMKPLRVNGNLFDPLIGGAQKWETNKYSGVPLKYINQFTDYFMSKLPGTDHKRVLTEHEVINGFGEMGRLKMSTSSGYYAKWFDCGKKEIFAALPQEYDDDSGEALPLQYIYTDKAKTLVLENGETFIQIMKRKEEMMKRLELPSFPFICALKDELRSAEKVKVGKTRVFEQSSIDFVMLCRKYLGHFINMYRTHAGFTLYHGIGREPESVWKQYAQTLYAHSPIGHAFDYKNFDGSLPQECFTFFEKIILAYYKDEPEEDNNVRRCLCVAMQNAIHIVGGFAFESTQGNKSGNAFTDVFNSISNTFLIWITFISWQITVKHQPANLSAFDHHVKMLTYGDDVVMSLTKEVVEGGFNGKHIQECLAALGVTITSANKIDEIEEYLNFSELTYLKRPFVWDEEYAIWKAPLPIKDILKELKYRPKTAKNNIRDLHDRLENTQRYLVNHDLATFKEWQDKLRFRTEGLGWDVVNSFGISYDALCRDIRVKQEVCPLLY